MPSASNQVKSQSKMFAMKLPFAQLLAAIAETLIG